MPTKVQVPLSGGHNDKLDPRYVGFRQLIQSQGAEYRTGDPVMIHKIAGRSLFDTLPAGKFKGGVLATYDDATTFILAVGGTELYYADASGINTGTFTALTLPEGSRSANTVKVSAAHFNNRWYVVTGEDKNVVVESDATVVNHGMDKPAGQPQLNTRADAETIKRPGNTMTLSSDGNAWVNTASIIDTEKFTFGSARLTNSGDAASAEFKFTATTTFADKTVELRYMVAEGGFVSQPTDQRGPTPDTEARTAETVREKSGVPFTMTIELSTNSGSSFTVELTEEREQPHDSVQLFQAPVGDSVPDEDVHVRFTVTTSDVGQINPRIYDVNLNNGRGGTTFTLSGNLYYAVTEYDAKRGWESALSAERRVDAGTAVNAVEVIPQAQVNDNATHYRIYRTTDLFDFLNPLDFGQAINMIPIDRTSAVDRFVRGRPSDLPFPSYPWLVLDTFGNRLTLERHVPPRKMSWIGNFKGSLFGLEGRSYFQSIVGEPQNWPAEFTIERFPFRENSQLKVGYQVGDVLWIGGDNGIVLLESPILVQNGSLRVPPPRRLEGAPGVVGGYAATPLSFSGESLVAWVSNHGVYISNLATFGRITDDIDWEANLSEANLDTAVLFWREKKEQLVLLYDSDGDGNNDSFALIHMSKDLRTQDDRPRITWGHAGNLGHWFGGRIGGRWVEYSGDSNGSNVYFEDPDSTSDASDSHNTASEIPFTVQTGRQYFEGGIRAHRGSLFMAPSGTATLTLSFQTGRDEGAGSSRSKAQSVTLNTPARHQFFNIADAGDFAQFLIEEVGTTGFSLGNISFNADLEEDQGEIET